ncbi:MAG: mucoidy inhibitor MuiA family protein [Bacteroidota bacterium]
MHKNIKTVLLIVLCAGLFLNAAEIKSKSKIASVTVFNDQALITRVCKENIQAGAQTVIVTDLPWMLVDQSLKVTGTSDNGTKISDIKIDQLFLDTIPEGRIAELTSRIITLKNEKNSLERANIITKSQLDAVDAMKENYTRSLALQNSGQKASVEEWEKLLQFVEKKKTEYTERMESVRREIDGKIAKVKALEDQIAFTGGAAKKEMKQISVLLNAEKSGTVRLEISYLISGASWTPSYEVRAQSSEKTVQLTYSGNVQQSTGEPWENVNMILSTARPAASEVVPELSRWTIDQQRGYSSGTNFRGGRANETVMLRKSVMTPTPNGNTLSGRIIDNKTGESIIGATVVIEGTSLGGTANTNGEYVIYNIPSGTYNVRVTFIGYQSVVMSGVIITSSSGARQTFYLTESNVELNEVVVMSERAVVSKQATNAVRAEVNDMISLQPEESVSSSQITSSAFTIRSPQTIPSDNQPHKVGISIEENPVAFVYHIVPKQIQSAFLLANGKNTRDFPLLAGRASIFLDNAFVASVSMKTVMPKDSFSINLGIDEAIRVERKLVKRFKEQTGTFTSKNKISFEYLNTVENFKKYPVDVILFDQVPVPADEKFSITVTDPDPKSIQPNSDGIYRMRYTLQSAEKRSTTLKFSVEYPSDTEPNGLPR